MQTKHLCVLIHIWTKVEVGAPWNRFKPSSKIFYWPFQGGASFVDHLLCFRARLFIDALWRSPTGKWLTSWLSFVMSNCDVVTFPLVSWVRCGAWLYIFFIFALFLTLSWTGYWFCFCTNTSLTYFSEKTNIKLFQDNYNFVLWFKMNPICSLLSGATLLKAPCGGFICCFYLNSTLKSSCILWLAFYVYHSFCSFLLLLVLINCFIFHCLSFYFLILSKHLQKATS